MNNNIKSVALLVLQNTLEPVIVGIVGPAQSTFKSIERISDIKIHVVATHHHQISMISALEFVWDHHYITD